MIKRKYEGQELVTEYENPPLIPGEEYRTTERIHGKAVYKRGNVNGGIEYRLEDETEWKQYTPAMGSVSMTLLWENASPNSNFAPQTIELELSHYSHVGIEAKWVASEGWNEQEIKMFCKGSSKDGRMMGFVGADTNVVSRRITSISDSGITFADGKKGDLSDYSTSSNVAIPTRIYGINGIVDIIPVKKTAICGTFLCGQAICGQ